MNVQINLRLNCFKDKLTISLDKNSYSEKLVYWNKDTWLKDNFIIAESETTYTLIIEKLHECEISHNLKKVANCIFKDDNDEILFCMTKDEIIKSLINSIIKNWNKEFTFWETPKEYYFTGRDSCAVLAIITTIIEELRCV